MDNKVSKGSINTPAHQKLARQLAEEAITLLKNKDGVLPIGKDVKTIAVIGPNAAEAVIEGGGSSRVPPLYRVSPLEGLTEALAGKVKIEYEAGSDNVDAPFTIPTTWLKGGLHGDFYEAADFSGEPLNSRDGFGSEFWWHTAWTPVKTRPMSIRWTGTLTVPEDGLYKISLNHIGKVKLYLDDKLILESVATPNSTRDSYSHEDSVQKLQAGQGLQFPHGLRALRRAGYRQLWAGHRRDLPGRAGPAPGQGGGIGAACRRGAGVRGLPGCLRERRQ